MAEDSKPASRDLGEAAMQDLARGLAGVLSPPLVVYLQGELGAGKTTFARALLHGLGYQGRVKSPTYGLLEHYRLDAVEVLHLDLYRLAQEGELEFLGIPDLMDSTTVLLVEWPERGGRFLPRADVAVGLQHNGDSRLLTCEAYSDSGEAVCEYLLDISK